eukprot:gene17439-biopygen12878
MRCHQRGEMRNEEEIAAPQALPGANCATHSHSRGVKLELHLAHHSIQVTLIQFGLAWLGVAWLSLLGLAWFEIAWGTLQIRNPGTQNRMELMPILQKSIERELPTKEAILRRRRRGNWKYHRMQKHTFPLLMDIPPPADKVPRGWHTGVCTKLEWGGVSPHTGCFVPPREETHGDLRVFFANSAARSGQSEPGPYPNRMIRKALKCLSSDASKERFSGFADACSAPEWRFRVSETSGEISQKHVWDDSNVFKKAPTCFYSKLGPGAWGAHKARAVPGTPHASAEAENDQELRSLATSGAAIAPRLAVVHRVVRATVAPPPPPITGRGGGQESRPGI